MVIGVDLDDVLAEFSVEFIKFCNLKYGTLFAKKDFTNSEFHEMWGVTKEKLIERIREFDSNGYQNYIKPLPGAKEAITKLSQVHELHIITNRSIEFSENTEKWVNTHFPLAFSEIHFCSRGAVHLRSKNAVCKSIGANIIFEDHPVNVKKCAEDGIHVYLFDQPWNKEEFPLHPGAILRVGSWQDEILETLLI